MAIILHILLQLFPPNTPTDAFQPLSLWQFFTYVVVPHTVCQLIVEDFNLTTTINAYKLMVESSDVSELINPDCDDDDELDRIKHMTTLALKQRISHGGTVHDAAKALVALQYSKKPNDCLGTNLRILPLLALALALAQGHVLCSYHQRRWSSLVLQVTMTQTHLSPETGTPDMYILA
ncbi:hypothetical protein EDD15DRAFT_2365927 [Pisolithus albus]|nr:hypothetical protein EDD15DRAFT_2365927 [Pisolithus albus]